MALPMRVGEDLAEFAWASTHGGGAEEFCIEEDRFLLHQRLMQLDDSIDQRQHVDLYGLRRVAIERKSAPGDFAKSHHFVEQEFSVAARFFIQRWMPSEKVGQIEDGLQRVVDLVGNTGGEAADCGHAFRLEESRFSKLSVCDIPGDLGDSDDSSGGVADGRDGEGDVNQLAVLTTTSRLEMFDSLSGGDFSQDHQLLE